MPFRLYSIYLIRLFLLHMFWYPTLFIEIAAPFEFRVYLAFNACYFIFNFVCLILPSWLWIIDILMHWYIYVPIYSISYFFSRLKLVAEERMVQGLWLHRPAVLPLGVLRRVLGSLLEEEQRRLQLHSLNRLRPLLRHAPPALRLVSRFPIPHYLLRTLG